MPQVDYFLYLFYSDRGPNVRYVVYKEHYKVKIYILKVGADI